jgi:hypothetical protein
MFRVRARATNSRPVSAGGNENTVVSLYKRGNVYWSYVWQDDVRYGRSIHTGKLREAEKLDHAHKAELEAKKHQPGLNPEMTFDELFVRFVGSGALKPFHLDRSVPLLSYFGTFALKDITKGATARYRVERKEQKTKLSQTIINRDLECLRHLLYWAVDEGILLVNPLNRLRLERERRPKRPILSVAEEDALLKAAAKHIRPMLIMALDTGCGAASFSRSNGRTLTSTGDPYSCRTRRDPKASRAKSR